MGNMTHALPRVGGGLPRGKSEEGRLKQGNAANTPNFEPLGKNKWNTGTAHALINLFQTSFSRAPDSTWISHPSQCTNKMYGNFTAFVESTATPSRVVAMSHYNTSTHLPHTHVLRRPRLANGTYSVVTHDTKNPHLFGGKKNARGC